MMSVWSGFSRPARLWPLVIVCALALCLGATVGAQESAEGPAPEASSTERQERLARLLARAGDEPLLAITCPDLFYLRERLATTHMAGLLLDERYTQGRSALIKQLDTWTGADSGALWRLMRANMSGPVALVLTRVPAVNGEQPQGFRLVLHLSAFNHAASVALREAWPRIPPQAGNFLSLIKLEVHTNQTLDEAPEPPAWARQIAADQAPLQLRGRLGEMHRILQTWQQDDPTMKFDGWLRGIQDAAEQGVDAFQLNVHIHNGRFLERMRVRLNTELPGTLGRVVGALHLKPHPWASLTAALPADQDVALLTQASLKHLGDDLPVLLQAIEQTLRGKKWTQKYGEGADATDPQRFRFLTDQLVGSFGLVGKPSLTGKAKLAAAFVTTTRAPETMRQVLIEGLEAVDAEFATQNAQGVARIGDHAPLAAQFKGRGLLRAPVIGLSPGWVWLCSTTGSYQELARAFATGRTMAHQPIPVATPPKDVARQIGPPPLRPPERSALQLTVDLEKLTPILYAAWLLGEEGPRIGGERVPLEFLPQNGLFTNRLGTLRTDLWRDEEGLQTYAEAPVPFTSTLLMGLLGTTAEGIKQLKAERAEALRRRSQMLGLDEVDASATPAPATEPVPELAP